MTTDRMARSFLRQAVYRLELVERAIADRQYATAVRWSQEAVELGLKAALRAAGVEPPRWHDVGAVLIANAARLPASLQEIADRLVRISAELRQDREPAFYGDEAGDRTPDDLYGEADARRAHADAAFAVGHVRDALDRGEPS